MTAARKSASIPLFLMSALVMTMGKPSQAYDTTETAPPSMGLAVEEAASQPPASSSVALERAQRVAKIRALRGKYAFISASSDDYLRMKHEQPDRY